MEHYYQTLDKKQVKLIHENVNEILDDKDREYYGNKLAGQIATEIKRKKTVSKAYKSKLANSGIIYNISCNSAILFRNKDNKIFAPTTKFKSLLSVGLYPITWVSPK